MSTFPSVISTFSTKVNGQLIDASDVNNLQSDVSQIEKVIGTEGDTSVAGTLEYFIKSPASNGGGHVQVANKGGTGQTIYSKGDILVAQSSSVLTKLAVGSDSQVLVADANQSAGIRWATYQTSPTVRVYSTASVLTWVKPSLLSYIAVEMVGGGGGGHDPSGNNDDTDGGTSAFGSLVTASGGQSGLSGMAGGTGSGGDFNLTGESGNAGFYTAAITALPKGGASYFGKVAQLFTASNNVSGGNGVGYGNGGGGAKTTTFLGNSGGGGGYARKVVAASSLASSYPVVVATAGTKNTNGSSVASSGTNGLVIIYEY